MRLNQCHNFQDFRRLARERLPGPIFNYIDGGATTRCPCGAIPRRSTLSILFPTS